MVTKGIPIAEREISYTAAMPTLTVEQVIAAMAFLGWSQRGLGDASDLPFEAVRDFERAIRRLQ